MPRIRPAKSVTCLNTHTYATRLLESGCDIVTVQKLMGHSDIETTQQYLNPDETLKRNAVNRLSITQK